MIRNWRCDKGGDYFEQSVRTAWRCTLYSMHIHLDVEQWFLEQGAKTEVDYEFDFRYNSGNPAYFITIYKEELATAFLLRWQ